MAARIRPRLGRERTQRRPSFVLSLCHGVGLRLARGSRPRRRARGVLGSALVGGRGLETVAVEIRPRCNAGSGLTAGDRLIVAGQRDLKDGDAVKVLEVLE